MPKPIRPFANARSPVAKLAAALNVTPQTRPKVDLQVSVDRYLDLKATIQRLEAEMETVKGNLKEAAYQAHKEGEVCQTDTHTVGYIESHSVKLSTEKLLKLGVKPTIIEKATVKTPYAYAKVTEKKEARLAREAEGRGGAA